MERGCVGVGNLRGMGESKSGLVGILLGGERGDGVVW